MILYPQNWIDDFDANFLLMAVSRPQQPIVAGQERVG
jgi:hypothetical protein